jgi:hypothetical protein
VLSLCARVVTDSHAVKKAYYSSSVVMTVITG